MIDPLYPLRDHRLLMRQTSGTDPESVPADARTRLARFDDYQAAAADLFPALPRNLIDLWSLTPDDAMALSCFFDCWHRRTAVIEIGSFIGASAFFFGQQPGVEHVLSIDPNPLVAVEINDKKESIGSSVSPEALDGVRVFDIANRVLAASPDTKATIEFVEGVAASPEDETLSSGNFRTVAIPAAGALDIDETIGFVDGLHTASGVEADLTALARANPFGLIFLDDCRNYWGPFVQSGVAHFLEKFPHRFRLLCDVHPSLSSSTLGLVYPHARTDEIETLLNRIGVYVEERYVSVVPSDRETDARTMIRSLQEKLAASREAQARLKREAAALSALIAQHEAALLAIQSTRSWRFMSAFYRVAVTLRLRRSRA